MRIGAAIFKEIFNSTQKSYHIGEAYFRDKFCIAAQAASASVMVPATPGAVSFHTPTRSATSLTNRRSTFDHGKRCSSCGDEWNLTDQISHHLRLSKLHLRKAATLPP